MYSYSFIVFSTIVICAGAGYLCLFLGRRNKTIEQPNGAIGYRVASFTFFCFALTQIGQSIDIFVLPIDNPGVSSVVLVFTYSYVRAKNNNWKSSPIIGFIAILSVFTYLMGVYEAYF